jgi:hypothetical protein
MNRHEIVPILLLEKSTTRKPVTKDYSRGIIDAKFFAPAVVVQRTASTLIFSINLVVDVSCQLKTLLFRSFQTSQMISPPKET